MPGSKISNVQENRRFAAPFLHSELRRELRKITWRWEKSKVGLDYRIVNKMMSSLEGGYGIFQMCVNQMHRDNGQGLLKAKTNLH